MEDDISLVWELDALNDRENIFEYLYEFNPISADKTDEIIESIEDILISSPLAGVCKEGVKGRCFILTAVPFNIYYDFDGRIIRILRVLHQKRQFPKLTASYDLC